MTKWVPIWSIFQFGQPIWSPQIWSPNLVTQFGHAHLVTLDQMSPIQSPNVVNFVNSVNQFGHHNLLEFFPIWSSDWVYPFGHVIWSCNLVSNLVARQPIGSNLMVSLSNLVNSLGQPIWSNMFMLDCKPIQFGQPIWSTNLVKYVCATWSAYPIWSTNLGNQFGQIGL